MPTIHQPKVKVVRTPNLTVMIPPGNPTAEATSNGRETRKPAVAREMP